MSGCGFWVCVSPVCIDGANHRLTKGKSVSRGRVDLSLVEVTCYLPKNIKEFLLAPF